jgi:hypothetical protein
MPFLRRLRGGDFEGLLAVLDPILWFARTRRSHPVRRLRSAARRSGEAGGPPSDSSRGSCGPRS